jgi:hypothetical protein
VKINFSSSCRHQDRAEPRLFLIKKKDPQQPIATLRHESNLRPVFFENLQNTHNGNS